MKKIFFHIFTYKAKTKSNLVVKILPGLYSGFHWWHGLSLFQHLLFGDGTLLLFIFSLLVLLILPHLLRNNVTINKHPHSSKKETQSQGSLLPLIYNFSLQFLLMTVNYTWMIFYSTCSFCSLNMNYCNNGHLNNINDNISMFIDEWLLSHIEGAVGVTQQNKKFPHPL